MNAPANPKIKYIPLNKLVPSEENVTKPTKQRLPGAHSLLANLHAAVGWVPADKAFHPRLTRLVVVAGDHQLPET